MMYEGEQWRAKNVEIGAFKLSDGLVDDINNWDDLPITSDHVKKLSRSLRKKTQEYNGMFYIGTSPTSPDIGDIRVSFEAAYPAVVSLVAQQTGGSFSPFQMAYSTIEDLRVGSFTKDQMFEKLKQENVLIAWAIRAGGLVLMVIGLSLVFKPLSVVADVIPLLGSIVGAGMFLFAAFLGFGLSVLTISIAWIFYRPMIGIPLVILSVASIVALMVLGFKLGKKAKGAVQGQV
jgi:hypothetical protein